MAAERVRTDPDPNGLASMLAELLRQNLERDPGRLTLIETRESSYAIKAHDIGLSITLRVGEGRIEVANGTAPIPADIRIRADAATLLEFSSVPLRFGQPDVFAKAGRDAIGKVLSGRMKVKGMLVHPLKLGRLNRLLSVN